MTDYQTKKGRITKKQPHVDFNLADNDDFFGFDSRIPVTKAEKAIYAILAVFVLATVYQALTFIF